MTRYIVWISVLILLVGCAGSRITTHIGDKIGMSFEESAVQGIQAADAIKAWPYVSGQIKGIYAKDFEDSVPNTAKFIMSELDRLSIKETLTVEDRGLIIGYFVRLEALTLEFGWNRYGVSIYQLVIKYLGG